MEPNDLAILIGAMVGGLGALGAFVWTMFRVARGVAQINRAVNHADPDEPTLRERVISIEQRFDAHDARAAQLGERVQRLEILGTTRHDEVLGALGKVEKAVGRLATRTSKVEATQRESRRRTS